MLFDTNILIGYLKGDESIIREVDVFRDRGIPLSISTIVVTEILSLASLTASDITHIRKFIREFSVLPFDIHCADAAAHFRRSYNLKFADAAVVATAYVHSTQLVTRDSQLHKVKEVTFVDM